VAFEKFVSIYNKKIIFTALRFSTACGISSRLRLDLVLNDFLASAILKNKIELLSKGDSWRPLIDVSDMCRAIDWAMHRKSLNNITVNVGKEKNNIKILNLAKKVKKFFRNITLKVNRAAVSDNRSYKVDFSLFKKIAPYHQPIKNIDQIILELKNFLKKQEIQKDFRNSDLIRLKSLEKLRNADKINKDLYWN
jgi:UDP-glucose 4-epimerase